MNCKKLLTIRIVALVVLVVAISAPNLSSAASANSGETPPVSRGRQAPAVEVDLAQGSTPLQQALRSMLEERGRAGLPVPQTVSYGYDLSNSMVIDNRRGIPSRAVTVTGTTVVHFDHPRQAGLDRWPDVIIEETLLADRTGFILPGDYSTAVRDTLTKAIPGIWDQYIFGYEPRTYTFQETLTVLYPQEEPLATQTSDNVLQAGAARDLVMGISTTGPRFYYAIERKWETCVFGSCITLAEAKAGFELDWDIGFRLPVTVELLGPHPLLAGSRPFSIAITGRDWSAQQFQQVGLQPVNGNEFVLQYVFFMGARAAIAGVTVLDAAWEGSYNGSRSFATPVGLGASFPIPAVNLPPQVTGLQWSLYDVLAVGIGLSITPHLEAGGVTANWQAMGDAVGSGQLAYNAAGSPFRFSNITVGDFNPTTSLATIRLSSIRYRFSQFVLQLGGYLQFELFGWGTRSGTFTISSFDLTPLTGGLWLSPHPGTPSDFAQDFFVAKSAAFLPTIRR